MRVGYSLDWAERANWITMGFPCSMNPLVSARAFSARAELGKAMKA